MKEDRVAQFREEFSNKSDDDLIFIIQDTLESSKEHIAAKQLLSARQEAKLQQRHVEALTETTRANKLSRIAIGIAIFAALVAVFALALQWRESPSSKQPPAPVAAPSKEAQLPPPPAPSQANPAQTPTSSTKTPPPKPTGRP
jgi:hypothetical protein